MALNKCTIIERIQVPDEKYDNWNILATIYILLQWNAELLRILLMQMLKQTLEMYDKYTQKRA